MSNVATHRLIDASAALGPAERALLNLWIHRGLDDPALARMTGLSPDSLADRRGRIVDSLSDELGLPPAQVQKALTEIAASSAAHQATAAPSNGASATAGPVPTPAERESSGSADETEPEATPAAVGSPSRNGYAPTVAAETVGSAVGGSRPLSTPPVLAPAQTRDSSRRRGAWIMAAVLAVLAVGTVLLFALGSGGVTHRHGRVAAVRAPAVPTPPPSPTSPSPSPTVSRPPTQPLAALPGGLNHATGSILLIGTLPRHLKLELSVRGLPSAHRGHYEVWLYNSILDSEPLTRLRAGRHGFTIKLPRDARHYRWLDVSFQPAGMINHSGESVLRSPNPAAVSRARLKRRSSRRRHPLRRAANGSNSASTSK